MTSTVTLNPSPGFVVKSTTLQQSALANSTQIPKGLKVFINIAWDPNAPPPPLGSEDVIQKAMLGEDLNSLNPDDWYVPTVVSEGRQDTDKSGKPAVIFDAVFNSSLKARTLKDPAFKMFLVELAFQRIEAQSSIPLSREIGTPNIISKGKLLPRVVQIPSILYPEGHPMHETNATPKKPLIEEIQGEGEVEGISKSTSRNVTKTTATTRRDVTVQPSWTWSKTGTKIRIIIQVPNLTHAHMPTSTLDLEPRRIILSIPGLYALDVNLDASDAELVVLAASSENADKSGDEGRESALTLKRARDLDVGSAKAEWRVAEGVIIIYA